MGKNEMTGGGKISFFIENEGILKPLEAKKKGVVFLGTISPPLYWPSLVPY